MKRILVTGGNGFIGSHTSIVLLQKDYEVVIVDSFINSSRNFYERIKILAKRIDSNLLRRIIFFEGDIRDKNLLEGIFRKSANEGKRIVGVIHFAGLKAVAESLKEPSKYWDFNFIGTFRLIEVMEKYDCRTLIFSSSATVYGCSKDFLISENAAVNPINPYGHTKAAIENFLKNIYDSKSDKWRIACLRYFNPIGAHSTGLIGDNPNGIPNNIFPFINQVAIGKIERLEIFGNDWDTSDGTCIRDYIHVMDLAEGHILSLEFLLENECRFINLNLGTGIGTSVLELVNIFQEENKVKVPFNYADRRVGDIARIVADNGFAYSLLNWKPTKTINEMCKDGWRWQQVKG